jgi:hypothetical protein
VASKVKFVTQGQRSGIYLTDFQQLNRELRIIQPSLVRQLQSDFKRIAKPVQTDVKQAIPISPPTSGIHKKKPQRTVSGFYPRVQPGRVTWGSNYQNKNIPVKSVKIETPSATSARRAARRSKNNVASIARLRIDNAGVVLADMAGRTGKDINKYQRTRVYDYSRSPTGKRSHRINNQGRAMIRALDARYGRSSRFVWKAADKSLGKVRVQSRMVLEKAYARINRKLSS